MKTATADKITWPYVLLISEDGLLINGSGYKLDYIKNMDLSNIIESAKKTVLYNKKNKITDDFIDLKNGEYIKNELNKTLVISKNISIKSKKVCDLYLIRDTILGTLKIGISNDVKKRLQQIQNATSNTLELLFVIPNKSDIEFDLHKKFGHLRLASEWFKYDKSIIDLFNDLSNGL